MSKFVPCRIAELPLHLQVEAGIRAILEHPGNEVAATPSARTALGERAIAYASKYWKTAGVSLGVYFMDGGSIRLKKRILDAANLWAARGANVKFFEVSNSAQAQIRIAYTPGWGYYSYLGTDCLLIPADEQTMNLDSFNDLTPQAELERVVWHEFGHVLALGHEHFDPSIQDDIDPDLAIPFYMQWQGWDEQTVRDQVLYRYRPDEVVSVGPGDRRGIMMYEFPAQIMRSRRAIPGGSALDDNDYALASRLYPSNVVVSPPPPSPPPSPPPQPPGVLKMGVGTFLNGKWFLTGADGKQRVEDFGAVGDIPVVGDWNGDGTLKLGVYRPGTSTFYLAVPGGVKEVKVPPGGNIPVWGHW